MTDRYFSKQTFAFLSALAANNNREWFEAHKQEYEDYVRTPALDFINDMAEEMPAISKHFRALPKKVGGSLMRVQRDTRFSRDKTPYKTNVGIQFRHEVGKDVHAPGYYVHIEPGECFIGVGLWHPEADVLFKVREAIAKKGEAWVAARDDKDFRRFFFARRRCARQRASRFRQRSSSGGGFEAQGFHRACGDERCEHFLEELPSASGGAFQAGCTLHALLVRGAGVAVLMVIQNNGCEDDMRIAIICEAF